MSFCLRFVTKRDFDCEQVEQQTSQTELKQCCSCSTFRNHASKVTNYKHNFKENNWKASKCRKSTRSLNPQNIRKA